MKSFTDAAGRTWTLTLNLGTAMAVKAKLGIDLLAPEAGDPPLLTRLRPTAASSRRRSSSRRSSRASRSSTPSSTASAA